MRSPKCGEDSRRSTTFSYASGLWSLMNASTSSGFGGKPVRSKYRRRMSVTRSASGDDLTLAAANFARMNLSTGLLSRLNIGAYWKGGSGGRFTGSYAQWPCHGAPCSTHFFMTTICRAVNFLPDFGGGIFLEALSERMRW